MAGEISYACEGSDTAGTITPAFFAGQIPVNNRPMNPLRRRLRSGGRQRYRTKDEQSFTTREAFAPAHHKRSAYVCDVNAFLLRRCC